MTVAWCGRDLPIYGDPTTPDGHTIGIPIAHDFVDRMPGDGLEVGDIIGGTRPRTIVEPADILAVDGTYDWVVSVGTVEHVGWDIPPRDPFAAIVAVTHLHGRLRPGGRLLVTFTLAYHPPLRRWAAVAQRSIPNLVATWRGDYGTGIIEWASL